MNTNRKIILLFSAFGTAVAFAILGCYYIFSESNPNSKYIKISKSYQYWIDEKFSDIPWVPTLCLILHLLLFNSGYGCITFPLMAELLPINYRTKGLSILMVFGGLVGFLSTMSFSVMQTYLEIGPIFLILAGLNLLGLIYLLILLPSHPEKNLPWKDEKMMHFSYLQFQYY